jgi:isopenicillin N synthase-like dioxygenase
VKKGIELLNLPLQEKLKIEMANSKHFLGYAKLGNEITAQKVDYREQFDVCHSFPSNSKDLTNRASSLQPKFQHQNRANPSTETCEDQTNGPQNPQFPASETQ